MLPKACSGASCCRQKQAGGEGRGLLPRITALQGLALCLGCSEKPRPTQLPARASFYSPYPLLSLGAGGQPSARLFMLFFLSFSMRINLLSVDCETVLQTESYRSCGFFIATSIFRLMVCSLVSAQSWHCWLGRSLTPTAPCWRPGCRDGDLPSHSHGMMLSLLTLF